MSSLCPYTENLVCDIFYRCDECFSQSEKARDVVYRKIRCSCQEGVCEADPALCERFQSHQRRLERLQTAQLVRAK